MKNFEEIDNLPQRLSMHRTHSFKGDFYHGQKRKKKNVTM
jgi:hypothetical protein